MYFTISLSQSMMAINEGACSIQDPSQHPLNLGVSENMIGLALCSKPVKLKFLERGIKTLIYIFKALQMIGNQD